MNFDSKAWRRATTNLNRNRVGRFDLPRGGPCQVHRLVGNFNTGRWPASTTLSAEFSSGMLAQWCTIAIRSKVGPMKDVAKLTRNHIEGIVA